jgi:hypothetical protein
MSLAAVAERRLKPLGARPAVHAFRMGHQRFDVDPRDIVRGLAWIDSKRNSGVTSPVVQTVLRTGRCNDTSPPAWCCKGTVVPGGEPVRRV